ncbi:MAG: diadenosine tetraphosphate (Ap4A) HIT family hydrolase [Arenicella sp.]|jgi:diadenosine tetraphosphate (Ap4A) HIT family hydrolase
MFKLHPQLKMDTFRIGDLPLCEVLLMNESQFPWLILVPRKENISELYQLPKIEIRQANIESLEISRLMMQFFVGDKLNVAALGNLVPQLHIHHIVRNRDDSVWPQPVWGNFTAKPYSEAAANAVLSKLREQISLKLDGFVTESQIKC